MAVGFWSIKKGLNFRGFETPVDPVDGDVYFDSIQGFLGYENGSWGPLGGGGVINYNTNPTIGSTNGYNLYNDGATPTPIEGSGGTVTNLTFVSTQTDPLVGHTMGILTKAAANAQGEGMSYDFTTDPAFSPGVLQVSFQYQASANFVLGPDSDIQMWIYDITNSVLIPLMPNNLVAGVAAPATYTGYFQTNYNSTSYRLIWHIATTNALAWTFNLANVVITPSISSSAYQKPPVMTQFTYTGASVNYIVPQGISYLKIRAVGAGGAGGSSLASGGGGSGGYFEGYFFNLSPGSTIPIYVGAADGQSTTLGGQINLTCTGGSNGNSSGGSTSASGGAGGTVTGGPTVPNNLIALNGGTGAPGSNTTNIALGGSGGSNPLGQGGGGGGYNGATPTGGQGYGSGGGGGYTNNAAGANGVVIIEEYYPSANSNNGVGDAVKAFVQFTGSAYASGTIVYDTVVEDNYGAYNPSTGIWTCPVTGTYLVYSQADIFNNAGGTWTNQIVLLVNGGTIVGSSNKVSFPPLNVSSSFYNHVNLNAGDTVQIYWEGNNGQQTVGGGPFNYLDIIQILPPPNQGVLTPTVSRIVKSTTTGSGTAISVNSPGPVYDTSSNPLTVTVIANGGDVEIGLMDDGSGGNARMDYYNIATTNAWPTVSVLFYRDGVLISNQTQLTGANETYNHGAATPSSFRFIDTPPPGTHVYTVQAYVQDYDGGTPTGIAYFVRLYARPMV